MHSPTTAGFDIHLYDKTVLMMQVPADKPVTHEDVLIDADQYLPCTYILFSDRGAKSSKLKINQNLKKVIDQIPYIMIRIVMSYCKILIKC